MKRGRKESDMGPDTKEKASDLKHLSNDELSHQLIESLRSTVELARSHLSFGDSFGIHRKTHP